MRHYIGTSAQLTKLTPGAVDQHPKAASISVMSRPYRAPGTTWRRKVKAPPACRVADVEVRVQQKRLRVATNGADARVRSRIAISTDLSPSPRKFADVSVPLRTGL